MKQSLACSFIFIEMIEYITYYIFMAHIDFMTEFLSSFKVLTLQVNMENYVRRQITTSTLAENKVFTTKIIILLTACWVSSLRLPSLSRLLGNALNIKRRQINRSLLTISYMQILISYFKFAFQSQRL